MQGCRGGSRGGDDPRCGNRQSPFNQVHQRTPDLAYLFNCCLFGFPSSLFGARTWFWMALQIGASPWPQTRNKFCLFGILSCEVPLYIFHSLPSFSSIIIHLPTELLFCLPCFVLRTVCVWNALVRVLFEADGGEKVAGHKPQA